MISHNVQIHTQIHTHFCRSFASISTSLKSLAKATAKAALILACLSGSIAYAEKLKVGATPVPHAQMLRFLAPDLAKAGVELEVVEFTDYVLPNIALNEKSIDANFMQHKPFLDKISKDRKLNLVSIAQTHIEPIGGYSKRINDIKDLKNGATILIPNDPTNGGRALILLHNSGLIKLQDPSNLSAKETDIIENPKKLKIKSLEAALLPKTLPDADLAIINGNYALQANLTAKDALIIEDSRSPYANILVVRVGDENKKAVLELKKAMQSQKFKDFIEQTYKGEIVPAF